MSKKSGTSLYRSGELPLYADDTVWRSRPASHRVAKKWKYHRSTRAVLAKAASEPKQQDFDGLDGSLHTNHRRDRVKFHQIALKEIGLNEERKHRVPLKSTRLSFPNQSIR